MLYERLQELIKKSNKSMNQIERELGYPRNTISSYKRQNPSTKRLDELAEYFNVSVDYLLGRENVPNSDYSDEENELIAAFRMEREDMTPDEQVKFNEAVKDLMKYAKERLNDDSIWKK
ncbi:helix-turn-helix domain-containing protein [Lactococcus lactis]|uniref:helix-turn-helix domain-containing protein n=1 Tax=Lactococcus lactis TaxID=1358 RepID=UPI00210BA5B7|nr:helix-turn-helix transcriptional regulator [Lactococcus lactis]MCQ4972470.1 helix-turn-helix domain-containing protein [Lactococcus lactis]MCQ4998276.1 helix-turn-helix domain-containing protein [Lactococcus lactis]MCT0077378.1 XRE family transcriptional regulator [Lactococcus lactis subsp. lactis]MDN6256178.1 helix-turn-helix domain-containing protein [Tetragenococcus koreensis]